MLSLAAFIPGPEFRSIIILAGIAFVLIVLSFIADIGPVSLLRGSGPLFLIILALFLIQGLEFSPLGISFEGLRETVIFGIRIGSAFGAGTLLFAVTTPGEIRKSLSRAEAALGIKKLKLSLSVSLMLGFLKRFFEIWEELDLSYRSRAGKKKFSMLLILVPPAIERMMIHAAETAEAMEARGMLP